MDKLFNLIPLLLMTLLIASCGGSDSNVYEYEGGRSVTETKLYVTAQQNLDAIDINSGSIKELVENIDQLLDMLESQDGAIPQKIVLDDESSLTLTIQNTEATISYMQVGDQIVLEDTEPEAFKIRNDKITMCASLLFADFGFGAEFNTCSASDAEEHAIDYYAQLDNSVGDTLFSAIIEYDLIRQ